MAKKHNVTVSVSSKNVGVASVLVIVTELRYKMTNLPGIEIAMTDYGPTLMEEQITDSGGIARFRLPAGDYEAQCNSDEFGLARSIFSVEEDEALVEVAMKLKKSKDIWVKLDSRSDGGRLDQQLTLVATTGADIPSNFDCLLRVFQSGQEVMTKRIPKPKSPFEIVLSPKELAALDPGECTFVAELHRV